MLVNDPEPEISRIMMENTEWKEPEKAVSDTVEVLRKLKKENRKRKLFAELATETDPDKKMEILKEISFLK